jgi:hypothetical protein
MFGSIAGGLARGLKDRFSGGVTPIENEQTMDLGTAGADFQLMDSFDVQQGDGVADRLVIPGSPTSRIMQS